MSILVGPETRVICQGMTGRAASFHTSRALAYGTKIVGGVTPGKGGRRHLDLPVFDTVAEAKSATGADASMIFVPALNAGAAMIEAIEAGIGVIVVMTERVPVLDMVRVRAALAQSQSVLVGPNSHGVLVPGACKIGVMATIDTAPGRIGVVSRSASLASEVVMQLTAAGMGQSTIIGIGGDPVHGLSFVDCLQRFAADKDTDAVVLIGEIGGREEDQAADYLSTTGFDKAIVALVAGRCAPAQRRMGHAGTLTYYSEGGATSKTEALGSSGVTIAKNVDDVAPALRTALAAAD